MSRRLRFCWVILISSLLVGAALTMVGCEPVGVVAAKLIGDVDTDAEYKLPRVKTLVFVENYTDPEANEDDSNVLTHYVVDNLKKHLNDRKKEEEKKEIRIDFVDPQDIYDLRTADEQKFHHMKIEEIGRTLGAKQVIYISLDTFGVLSTGGTEIMRGVAAARVKVINCVTNQTLWPEESTEGYPVNFESKLITPQQEITYDQARDGTMRTIAVTISRLFYKYNPSDDDDTDTFTTE